jgi:amino acid adenylation domain-containing protein
MTAIGLSGGVPRTLSRAFAQASAQHPERDAVRWSGGALTYAKLDARSNQIARQLQSAHGVVRGDLVGVALPRTGDLVATLLAVLKCGAGYVPLDPAYPAERLNFMLSETGCRVTVATAATAHLFDEGPVIFLDRDAADIERRSPAAIAGGPAPHDLAYVMFTSGSTGSPKGVAVEHASVSALIDWARETFSPAELGGLLAGTSICFDLSVFEILAPLCLGGRVLLADNVLALGSLPFRGEVRLVNTVPSAMRELIDGGAIPASVHTICLAGERFPAGLACDLRSAGFARILNLYGPTEDTVYSLWSEVLGEGESPAIGRPLPGARVYLLDDCGAPCPAGAAGEIYLAGPGLARGYHGRDDLTAERFLPDPFFAGERMYRTGDRGRRRPDGQFEFLGRLDQQVKIRGYRIELGEVEEAIRRQAGISDCAVAAVDGPDGAPALAAYVCGFAPERELRAALRTTLPAWMIPAAFVTLDDLPRSPNGKLDRQALPPPDFSARAAYRAPRNEREALVCRLFEEVTVVAPVGLDDDFFDIGGHSLSAMRLTARLRRELGLVAPLSVLFEGRTPEKLAMALATAEPDLTPPRPGDGDLPSGRVELSSGQRRLWTLDQIEGRSDAYNMPFAVRLHGILDRQALSAALAELVARHGPLRTVVEMAEDGEATGRLLAAPSPAAALSFEDLRALAAEEREPCLAVAVQQEVSRSFRLDSDFLLRSRLFQLDAETHVLVLVVHHAASDDASTAILARELHVLYSAHRDGGTPGLPTLRISYADYAAWRRALIETDEALAPQIETWRAQLAGAPHLLSLPCDRPRVPGRIRAAGAVPIRLDPELSARLKALARRNDATLFAVLLAGYAALLSRLSGQDNVVIGVPVADRRRAEVEPLVGFLLNTLPIRVNLSGDPDAATLTARCRDLISMALANADVPFEGIVKELGAPRAPTHTPVFQAGFAWQSEPQPALNLPGLDATAMAVAPSTAKFDLTLNLGLQADGSVSGFLEYDASLFDAATVARWSTYFTRTLAAMAASQPADGSAAAVSAADLLDADERRLLLETFNDTAGETTDTTLAELFEAQAKQTPEAVALLFDGRRMTYGALDAAANRLGRLLAQAGAGPERCVGVAVERSFDMVVALLAILKCGAAYLPLDPAYPPARLAFMQADAKPVVVVTTSTLASRVGGDALQLVLDDPDTAESLAKLESGLFCGLTKPPQLSPASLAYVLYTSGSTGAPKGVLTTHANVVSLAYQPQFAPIGPANTLLQFAPLAFDAATFEIWGALLNGARLVIAPPGPPDLDRLAELAASEQIDTMWLTASLFQQVLETKPSLLAGVKRLIAGGEVLPPTAVRDAMALYPELELINGYGPTETTTFACTRRITSVDAESGRIPIGAPIRNTRAYVLDASLTAVPIGAPGELYLAGAGVARGYLNRPELTRERFVASPFDTGERLYRTGDRARWRMDGALDFLGRTDDQVKVRGMRIEPGEIEAALREIYGVGEAAVALREVGGELRLVGYVAAFPAEPPPSAAELRAGLAQRLPEHMIPAVFLHLAAMPLTANGKLDRQALPDPEPEWRRMTKRPEGLDEANPITRQIAEIFGAILGRDAVSPVESFFDLGGHSLLGVRLMAEIERRLGRRLPLSALYSAPTASGLTTLLNREAAENASRSLVPLQMGGTGGEPVFIVQWFTRDLARSLGARRACYGLSYGLADGAHLHDDAAPKSVEHLAAHYIDEIRTVQPRGPYHLVGHSMGGLVAFEMARQLRALGEPVALLALMDTYVPARAFVAKTLRWRSLIASAFKAPLSTLMSAARFMRWRLRAARLALWRGLEKVLPDLSRRLFGLVPASEQAQLAAAMLMRAYEPKPYRGDVLFLRSLEPQTTIRTSPPPPDTDWTTLVQGRLEVRGIPGRHADIIAGPQAGQAAEVIEGYLRAESATPTEL